MKYNKMVYPYQGGGGVYSQPIITGLNVNASPIIQAASMPIDGGLEGYMGIQHLRQQREQMALQQESMALQQEQFRQRMLQQEKENAVSTMKMLSTLRDDITSLEILPVDAQPYADIQSKYKLQDLAKAAGTPGAGVEAMQDYFNASQAMFSDPDLLKLIQKKKQSDQNLETFAKLDENYITNYTDAVESVTRGEGMPAIVFDKKRADEDREIAKVNKQAADADALETAKMNRLRTQQAIAASEQQMKQDAAMAPYKQQELETDIELAKISTEIKREMLTIFQEEYAAAKTPEERAAAVNRYNGKTTKADTRSWDNVKTDLFYDLASKYGMEEAYKRIVNMDDDAATTSTGYTEVSTYRDPISIDGKTVLPSQLKQNLYASVKVPETVIDPDGMGNKFRAPAAGQSTIAYTMDGYLYTNNPHALINLGLTTEDNFYDGNVQKFDEQTWRVPLTEAAAPITSSNSILGSLPPQFSGLVTTSDLRTKEENERVGGVPDSMHLVQNGAVDVRTKTSMPGGQKGRDLALWVETPEGKAWLSQNGLEALWEDKGGNNEHLHIERVKAKEW